MSIVAKWRNFERSLTHSVFLPDFFSSNYWFWLFLPFFMWHVSYWLILCKLNIQKVKWLKVCFFFYLNTCAMWIIVWITWKTLIVFFHITTLCLYEIIDNNYVTVWSGPGQMRIPWNCFSFNQETDSSASPVYKCSV